MDKRGADGCDAEAERNARNEPSGTQPLATVEQSVLISQTLELGTKLPDVGGNLRQVSTVQRRNVVRHPRTTTTDRTYLEHDVADVEDRQHLVVIVALQTQILLQTRKPRITDVGAVNKAEKV